MAHIHNLHRRIARLRVVANNVSQTSSAAHLPELQRCERLAAELQDNMVQSYNEEIARIESGLQSPFRFGERNIASLTPVEAAACIAVERQRLVTIRETVTTWSSDTTSANEMGYYHPLTSRAKLVFWRDRMTPEILASMFRPCMDVFDSWATCYNGDRPTAFGAYAINRFCRTCTDMAAFVCRPRDETMALTNLVGRTLRASAKYSVSAGQMYRASRRLFTQYNAGLVQQNKAPIAIADIRILSNASLNSAGNRQTANVIGGAGEAGGADGFLWDF